MNAPKDPQAIVRLTCRTASEKRTTASMPQAALDKYVELFGSPGKFRNAFNEALRQTDEVMADKWLTRSMAVRLLLDKRLGR